VVGAPGATGDEQPPGDDEPPAPAWPYTSDIPWITPEETARLNPWGDEPPLATPTRTLTQPKNDTTWASPWDDDHDTESPGP
jgi:hypothetical protein